MPPEWDGEEIDVNDLPTRWVWFPESRALTYAEMEINAAMFTQYFACYEYVDEDVPFNGGHINGLGNRDKDAYEWTPEAVAGILGNITVESTINPGRWQNDEKPDDPETGTQDIGYGLVQWTPYSKYRDWAMQYDYLRWGVWNNNGYLESERIAFERREELQWSATGEYSFGFQAFTEMEEDPAYMADAFLYCYERPANPEATKAAREAWAQYWYDRVVLPIYGGGNGSRWWYWLFPYVFSKKYNGRWFA